MTIKTEDPFYLSRAVFLLLAMAQLAEPEEARELNRTDRKQSSIWV